eukprot:2731056-Pyramimonas_sp.AAC.1
MALVAFLGDETGRAMGMYLSVLPFLKIPMLPLDAFFDWRALPMNDDTVRAKKLKGASGIHMQYYHAAGLEYPPDLASCDPELQLVLAPLSNALVEVARRRQ